MSRPYFQPVPFAPTLLLREKGYIAQARKPRAKDGLDGFHFQVARSPEEFGALEKDWNNLFLKTTDSVQPFLSFNWNWHWCRHFLEPDNRGHDLRIITLWKDMPQKNTLEKDTPGKGSPGQKTGEPGRRLVMLWPMQVKTFLGRKHLHFIGDPVSQYGDVLLDRGEDGARLLHAGWDYISKNLDIDLVILRKVMGNAALFPLIQTMDALETGEQQGLSIDFNNYRSYQDYALTFKKKEQKNRRRKKRRLEQQGTVETHFFNEGPEARDLARLAIKMKRDWIEQKGLLSKAFHDERLENFFAGVAGSTRRTTGVLVSVLKVSGKAVAITVSLGQNRYRAMHISVIDLAFEKDSPGVSLLENTVARSIEQGDRVLDFLAPADPYKTIWCDSSNDIRDFAIPTNLAGHLYMTVLLKWVRQGGKNIMCKCPQKLRSTLYNIAAKILWNKNRG